MASAALVAVAALPLVAAAPSVGAVPPSAGTPGYGMWVRQVGSTTADVGWDVETDDERNIFAVGSVSGSVSGATGTFQGSNDVLIGSWTAAGTLRWARLLGTSGDDQGYGIAVDGSGNVYVAGKTNGSMPGAPTGNQGGYDAFLASYTNAGATRWVRQTGTAGADVAYGADAAGNQVLIAGSTAGTIPGTDDPAGGLLDAFVSGYSTGGTLRWARQYGSPVDDEAIGVATDGTDVFAVGLTRGTLPSSLDTAAGDVDAFALSLSSLGGDENWVRQYGTANTDVGLGVDVRGSTLAISGRTKGNLEGETNLGLSDAFAAALDPDYGDVLWIDLRGTSAYDEGNAVAVDPAGNVYLAGSTDATLSGSPDTTNSSGRDGFVQGYAPDGSRTWLRQIGTSSAAEGRGVATDATGEVSFTGGTIAKLTGSPTNQVGGKDAFVYHFEGEDLGGADYTAPTVAITTPADDAQYPLDATVLADYSCADEVGGSGLFDCSGDVADGDPIDTSAAGTYTFTVTASDEAGNTRNVTVQYEVLDSEAPTIEIYEPADGGTYTVGDEVYADYFCEDELGGSGIDTCIGDLESGDPIDTSTPGEYQFTVDAADLAGNTATATATYTIEAAPDVDGPAITITAPADGAAYSLGEEILADYSCEDEPGGSGLASCEGTVAVGEAIDTSTLGYVTFEVVATDNEGNESYASAEYEVVDVTAPAITVDSPTEAAEYEMGEEVFASYACEDEPGGSGVLECSGDVADGDPIDTSIPGDYVFSVYTEDEAGNADFFDVSYSVVDNGAPTVDIFSPEDGAVFELDEEVYASYLCDDAESGIDVCEGTVPDGELIDTSFPGDYDFEVLAIDLEGNETLASISYTVAEPPPPGPKLAIGDASVLEGDEGVRYVEFQVTLSEKVSSKVSFRYETSAGSADEDDDFRPAAGKGSITSGQRTLRIQVRPDAAAEGDEEFSVWLTDVEGAEVVRDEGIGTILDDDPGAGGRVRIGSASLNEGDDKTRTLSFPVALTAPTSGAEVYYAVVANGSAEAGVDFVVRTGRLKFSRTATQKVVKITVRPDTENEPTETFEVWLVSPSGVTIEGGPGIGTILDDD